VYREEAYTDPQIGRRALHEKETAVEVILPFLQESLGNFRIIPVLVGELRRIHGGVDERAIDSIVRTLESIIDDKTLVVACSDFTRYGAVHNFTPFTSNVLEGIAELDMQAFRLIERRQSRGFYAYLDATQNNISGAMPIAIAMRLMPRGSAGVLMGYDVTGRRTGNPSLSISYASLVFIDGSRPPFPSSPLPVPTAALPPKAVLLPPPPPLVAAPPIVEAAPKGQTNAGAK
jgi:AmmeMemoRadiSam system protein B